MNGSYKNQFLRILNHTRNLVVFYAAIIAIHGNADSIEQQNFDQYLCSNKENRTWILVTRVKGHGIKYDWYLSHKFFLTEQEKQFVLSAKFIWEPRKGLGTPDKALVIITHFKPSPLSSATLSMQCYPVFGDTIALAGGQVSGRK